MQQLQGNLSKTEAPWRPVHSRKCKKDLDEQYHPALLNSTRISRAPHSFIAVDTRTCPGFLTDPCCLPFRVAPSSSRWSDVLQYIYYVLTSFFFRRCPYLLFGGGIFFSFCLLHTDCKLEFQDLIQIVILVLLPGVLIYEAPISVGMFWFTWWGCHFNMDILVPRFYFENHTNVLICLWCFSHGNFDLWIDVTGEERQIPVSISSCLEYLLSSVPS